MKPNINEIILFDKPAAPKPTPTTQSAASSRPDTGYFGMQRITVRSVDDTWGTIRVKKGTD